MPRLSQFGLAALVLLQFVLVGCSDPTLEHRRKLGDALIKTVAWHLPNHDSIPKNERSARSGMGHARITAEACEASLNSSPPFSEELLVLLRAYAKSNRTQEAIFRKAIDEGRFKLTEDEQNIVQKSRVNDFFLFQEILKAIKIDELEEEGQSP